jgi:hypothetical protein
MLPPGAHGCKDTDPTLSAITPDAEFSAPGGFDFGRARV